VTRSALWLIVLAAVAVACSSSSKNDSANAGGTSSGGTSTGGAGSGGTGGAELGGGGGVAGTIPDASTGGIGGGVAGAGGGGGCDAGCQPVTLASSAAEPKLVAPIDIAVDATHVYFTVNHYDDVGLGSVMKASINGGGIVILASGQTSPYHIALDDAYVYWTNKIDAPDAGVSGSVMRVKKAGGAAEVVSPNQDGASGISVDDTNVYWANHLNVGNVKRKAKDGSGSAVSIATGQNKPFMTRCDPGTTGFVYFTTQEDGVVRKVAKGGGGMTQVSDTNFGMRPLAIDGADLFFGVFGSPGDVRKAPKASGAPSSTGLAGGTNFSAVVGLAVDSTHVYFTTQRNTSGIANQGSVMRTVRSGAGSAELVWQDSGLYPNPSGIAVDSQAIYWVEYDNSSVHKLMK
jgi:hypothetical protein